jgi:hypothetical protein
MGGRSRGGDTRLKLQGAGGHEYHADSFGLGVVDPKVLLAADIRYCDLQGGLVFPLKLDIRQTDNPNGEFSKSQRSLPSDEHIREWRARRPLAQPMLAGNGDISHSRGFNPACFNLRLTGPPFAATCRAEENGGQKRGT